MGGIISALSLVACLIIALPAAYLYTLALASLRVRHTAPSDSPRTRFAIAIPAHNEETVIAQTVTRLNDLDYPHDQFAIFVVADHSTDRTAANARGAGATCWECNDGARGGKGTALAWLFRRIFSDETWSDAVVVFDADTRVDNRFLRVMDARLRAGARVVQGNHRISNPTDAWFAALTWAMFIVDNRFQNLGRANLGWSAKNMGDSICFRTDILRRMGWGEGLTEDYEFRQKLLLQGIKIQYEPSAIGYGEAPISWAIARKQRERWLTGTYKASRHYAPEMLREGICTRDFALLDGALQAYLPSYSTLTLLALGGFVLHVLFYTWFASILMNVWAGLVLLLGVYPLIGLILEHAPARAYVAIWLGPVFMLWRTWLSVSSRFGDKDVTWVRTARRDDVQTDGVKE